MLAFYFGKLNRDDRGGHHLYRIEPDGAFQTVDRPAIPRWLWADMLDAKLTPMTSTAQGACSIINRDRWTVFAWHDYTADTRGGSNSAFILEGTHTFATALAEARRRIPSILARQPSPFLL